MEPAAVLCAGVAGVSLGAWGATQLPGRLRLPIPGRLVATATLITIWMVAAPRTPAAADPVPPLVRLAEGHADPGVTHPLETTHVVEPGDTLWDIAATTLARRTGRPPTTGEIARFWPAIYERNHAVIGDDPDLILPGQRLVVP